MSSLISLWEEIWKEYVSFRVWVVTPLGWKQQQKNGIFNHYGFFSANYYVDCLYYLSSCYAQLEVMIDSVGSFLSTNWDPFQGIPKWSSYWWSGGEDCEEVEFAEDKHN